MTEFRRAQQAVIARILEGDGHASRALRRAAFENAGLAQPVVALIGKVATRAYTVTDADIAAAKTMGLSEDQIFEVVVCAAIGQAMRQYDGTLQTLEAAIGGGASKTPENAGTR